MTQYMAEGWRIWRWNRYNRRSHFKVTRSSARLQTHFSYSTNEIRFRARNVWAVQSKFYTIITVSIQIRLGFSFDVAVAAVAFAGCLRMKNRFYDVILSIFVICIRSLMHSNYYYYFNAYSWIIEWKYEKWLHSPSFFEGKFRMKWHHSREEFLKKLKFIIFGNDIWPPSDYRSLLTRRNLNYICRDPIFIPLHWHTHTLTLSHLSMYLSI